ncbi:MAG: hypothetical protein ACXW1W_19205, partial [Methylococcaceae bacterium]
MKKQPGIPTAIPCLTPPKGLKLAALSAVSFKKISLSTPALRKAVMRHARSSLLTAVTLTTLFGCGNSTDTPVKPVQTPPPAVKIAQPLMQEVTEWDEYTGRIEAINSVDVR